MKRFLWKMQNALSRFMYGRYGVDKFTFLLLALYFILSILTNCFLGIVSLMLWILSIIILVYMVFRVLSRNITRRRKEGAWFDTLCGIIKSRHKLSKNKHRDRKTHVYRHCPSCKAVLRFRKVKGRHSSTCPRCGRELTIRI